MSEDVAGDFDRIAALPEDPAEGNARFHPWLLARVPAGADEALDLGCGSGVFARLLAKVTRRVLGIDLSPRMIAAARERSRGISNLEFQQVDVRDWQWPVGRFDCIVSIACLHHLPMEPTLQKIKSALRPGGTLLIVDLRRHTGVIEQGKRIASLPLDRLHRLLRTGAPVLTREARRAWEEHARTDRYLSVTEVKEIALRALPGAQVRGRLYWRYSLEWRKPTSQNSGWRC